MNMITLLASAARLVSGTGAVANVPNVSLLRGGLFVLDVTAAASLAGDTLDVYVQSSYDDGTTWDDFVHFTQVLGNGGAKKIRAKWLRDLVPTTPMGLLKDATLAVGVEQGPVFPLLRIKYVVVDGTGTHSFTFSVGMVPIKN